MWRFPVGEAAAQLSAQAAAVTAPMVPPGAQLLTATRLAVTL